MSVTNLVLCVSYIVCRMTPVDFVVITKELVP